MDDPSLSEKEHISALRGLRRINEISHTAKQFFVRLKTALNYKLNERYRILDIACADGYLCIELARIAKRHGLGWQFQGCDISERAIGYARTLAAQSHSEVSFFIADAIKDLDVSRYDAVINSLFLHHLSNEQIVLFLSKLRYVPYVLISDLIRSQAAYFATNVGVQLLTRSRVVHVDGPLSVRAALTTRELDELAQQAGIDGAIVRRSWPLRQMLEWRSP